MKNNISKMYLLGLICLSVNMHIHAQAPQGINYQAVARDALGKLLADQAINVEIALLEDASDGPVIYEETHKLNTDAFGLFTIIIGQGSPLIGTFDSVDWKGGPKFLQVSLDPEGGSNFINMGTTQLLSVPYAMYADKSGEAPSFWTQPDLNDLSYTGDVLIGGSADNFDGPTEHFTLRGKSKEWHIGVENKDDEFGVDSRFFISQSDSPDGTFHIFENGMLLVPRLHIKQRSSTGLILQDEKLGRGWSLGTRANGKLTFSEGTFSDAGSSTTTTRLAMTQEGKLGIGPFSIDNPTHELHMVHASTGGGGATAGLKIENEGSNNNWWAFYTTNSSGELEMYYKGSIRGEFDPADGEYRQRSDSRLKRDIAHLKPILSKILQLHPSTYYFKDVENPSSPSIGFIAQDVEPLFPELVGYAGEEQDIMTLNYNGFSVLAIKAIQEQQVIIEQLKQRIDALENKLSHEK